jgi:hypothetical protein
VQFQCDREQRRCDPALRIGVEGVVLGGLCGRGPPHRRVPRVHGAHGGFGDLVVAEADRVDVVEGPEEAVERPFAESAVPGDASGYPGIRELEEDRSPTTEEQHALRPVAAEGFAFVLMWHQYQLYASECAQAPHGAP